MRGRRVRELRGGEERKGMYGSEGVRRLLV